MKYAVVDVGSNSLRLILFNHEEDLKKGPIRTLITKLGDGVKKSHVLKKERMEDSFKVFEEFQGIVQAEGVVEVHAFCTSAVRGAGNGKDFAKEIEDRFGWKVSIIDGEEEALLGFLGATLTFKDEPMTLIDIGGGSTEIIQGKDTIEHAKSIEIGALKYTEEPVDLKELFKELPPVFGRLVGIGGTITTSLSMFLGLKDYEREKIHGEMMTLEDLRALDKKIAPMTEDEISKLDGIDPKRAGIIRGGLKILIHLLEAFGAEEMMVSDYGNLEGYAVRHVLWKK